MRMCGRGAQGPCGCGEGVQGRLGCRHQHSSGKRLLHVLTDLKVMRLV